MEISARIAQANGRLKSAYVGVRIEQRGRKLLLRATLPPKPTSSKKEPLQQRISIGLPANPDGVSRAEKEARKIGALLATKEFDWSDYLQTTHIATQQAGEAIERFKSHYLTQGGSLHTWTVDYWQVLKRIPQESIINDATLMAVISGTMPNSKTRQRACMALGALAKFLEVDFDPKPYRGMYRPGQIDPRDIPTDEKIARCFYSLENTSWQFVYGLMATYGLRNHEVFRADFSDMPVLRIQENTKTGARDVFPCFPEWVGQFDLMTVKLPPLTLSRTNSQIGASVTHSLSPLLPFKPYDLRHAWAIRTSIFGWPLELAARQMGHSVELHTRTYHRWISRDHQQKVYDLLVNRSDRPMAPSISES